jgi:hypothetical protein
MEISVRARKKAVTCAVWALGNDQSEGIVTSISMMAGRGLRNISFATCTEMMVRPRLRLIRTASSILPYQISKRQNRADKGSSRYNDPSQVIVKKKESMSVLWIMRVMTNGNLEATTVARVHSRE